MKKTLIPFLFAVSMIGAFAITAFGQKAEKVDEFGAVNEEVELLKLDEFTIWLQNTPDSVGCIIVYRGQTSRSGDVNRVIKRMTNYLIKRRGMAASRIKSINGGLRTKLNVELWMVPPGAVMPTPTPAVIPPPAPKKKP